MSLDPKHLKALKRRRQLARRLRCHGNTNSCRREHSGKKKISYSPPVSIKREVKEKKVGLIKKFINWVKGK